MKTTDITDCQRLRAKNFTALHHEAAPLLLPNAWDAASARIFELSGARAIGTSSAGVAFSCGYPDGERIPVNELRAAVRRISDIVTVPLTVDIETGFQTNRWTVLDTVQTILETGAVGINLEDAPTDSNGVLRSIDDQSAIISSIRKLANEVGIDLYINARTDTFWLEVGSPETRLDATLERLLAYKEAGASGVFVPGVIDEEMISILAAQAGCPLNILATSGCPDLAALKRLGVSRVSVGSGPIRAIMALTRRIGDELMLQGKFSLMSADTINYAEANELFNCAPR